MDCSSEEEAEDVSTNEMASLNLQDLDKSDLETMKGDTIGDTVYSAKWIINTLISLSKIREDGWTESLEESLCMLWDMTAEKDIVDFLMENDFLNMGECTLEISREPRLTEIILGIVGNMCCQPAVLKALSESNRLLSMIFELLSTDDPETLIQILRLLHAAMWDIQKNEESKWLQHFKDYCIHFGDALSFILQSSTNDDLLAAALDMLHLIFTVETLDKNCLLAEMFKVDRLVPALFESFAQLVPMQDYNHSNKDLRAIGNWLTIFSIIMEIIDFRLFLTNNTSDENYAKTMEVFSRILQPYKNSSNLKPLHEKAASCIHEIVEIISRLRQRRIHPDPTVIRTIVSIMHELRLENRAESARHLDQELDSDDSINDLQKYLETFWLQILESYSEPELLEIIATCESDVIKCLMEVATEYSEKLPEAVDKLLRVEFLANSTNQSA